MKLVHGHDQTVIAWIAKIYGQEVRQRPCAAMGTIDAEGVLRGAFVVTWKNDTTAELHVYGRTSNDTFRAMFETAFTEWGVHRLEVRTSRTSKIIKKSAPKFGFRFQGVEREFYGPGRDALVYFMLPSECRWLRKDHGITVRG